MARVASGAVWCATFSLWATPITRPYTIDRYEVSIRPDLTKQRLYGEVAIRFHNRTDNAVSALELDAGTLQIKSVMEGPDPQSFERNHGMLFVALTKPLRPDEDARTITVRYEAVPAPGLKFFPEQIYSAVTSDWMPCNDAPGEGATLHLTISAPQDMKAAASGQLTASRDGDGQSVTEWRLDSPAEPYWFGFALGSFSENAGDAEGVKLRVLGPGKQMLEPTAAAIHYLAERTGKRYPGETYTQVLVHGDAVHSMAGGLTLLPESYAQELAKQPDSLWLLTDALAHQWFGVAITAKDWSDLWLNEGISAFVAATYLGQRSGKESFEREVERSRQVYEQLRSAGRDRPLSDNGWTTHQQANGEIPEYKGVVFLYQVHQTIGDGAFWNGLRLYAGSEWEQAATSQDLQTALGAVGKGSPEPDKKGGRSKRGNSSSKGNPKSLGSLFDLWVYGISADTKSR